MRFKFKGIPVEIKDGRVISEDDLTRDLLTPVIEGAHGGPEAGDPYLNAITGIFGVDSVTDVEDDNEIIN